MIYMNRYRLIYTLLLTALMASTNASAGVTIKGNVYGGGNLADVKTNTTVNMGGGQVEGNVYGGGNLGDVGTIKKNFTTYNYSWKNSDSNGNADATNCDNTAHNNTIGSGNKNTGVCTVNISGGTIGTAGGQNTDPTNVANGNVFGGGKGNDNPKFYCEEGMVFATSVTISGGTTVHGCVFGGGEIGRVEDDTKVTISGTSETGIKGNVFGAGEGLETHGYSALVRGNTEVTVEGNAKIGHSVYGGGETASVGRFNVVGGSPATPAGGGGCTVIIQGSAQIGGDVYGAGMGLTPKTYTYNIDDKTSMPYRMMAKSMGSFTTENQKIWDNVDENNVKEYFPTRNIYLDFLRTLALASTPTVTIGGTATINGSVFGGGKLGITLGNVNVSMTGGTVNENVYGGGSLADTNTGNWSLNHYDEADANQLNEGETINDLFTRENKGTEQSPDYRYSRYNPTLSTGPYYRRVPTWANSTNKSAVYTTHVSLTGGKIVGDAYGGGLGQKTSSTLEDIEALVYGDVKVELNKDKTTEDKGCVVNRIFGCNNLNGSPKGHVQVYVYATQKDGEDKIGSKASLHSGLETGSTTTYDVKAVYGGGNLAPYIPVDALLDYSDAANKTTVDAACTEVYINGCALTSIKQVYAGGNAASVAGSYVVVNSVYEIEEVFGGGNGADPYYLNGKKYLNPGANVGYYNYTHFGDSGKGTGTEGDPYQPVDNTSPDASTKENRQANYRYGSGIARTEIRGGKVHVVYGGSNKKGNISTTAVSVYDGSNDCEMHIDQTYGGGKDAPIDGEVVVELACATGVEEIFGGAMNADINADVNLRITNGSSLKRVFGGNNTSGAINGSITVTIEEGGCEPIDIDDLYLGGYLAPYSVYGYEKNNDGTYKYKDGATDEDGNPINERIPLTSGSNPKQDPRLNVISATHIGNIYGGGYKAMLVGNPYVNVNMEQGKVYVTKTETDDTASPAFEESGKYYVYKDGSGTTYSQTNVKTEGTGDQAKYYVMLDVGEIDNIYGGGNLADIVGDTHVEIGTGRWVSEWDANGPVYESEYIDTNDGNKIKSVYYKIKTPAVTYTSSECETNNANLAIISTSTTLSEAQATKLNELFSLPDDNKYQENDHPRNETHVNVYNGTIEGYITTADIKTQAEWAWYDASGNETSQPTPARNAATITGDVFGGGQGQADATTFTCEKAMVGVDGDGADPTKRNGGTSVVIENGTVGGSVYGGGKLARVERNTVVTIGSESGIGSPVISGDVYGAGMGKDTHGYSGLVRGNATVTIQDDAKVRGNVYGGGEMASLGSFFVATTNALATLHGVEKGMPYDLKSGGTSTVIVRGSAEIGPESGTANDNAGQVFGAGKGVVPSEISNPGRYYLDDNKDVRWESYAGEANKIALHKYVGTLGITNKGNVIIDGSSTVQGAVYGGGKLGNVLSDTEVSVCATKQTSGTTVTYVATSGAPTIHGDVYGGGKGLGDTFTCEKAMIGKDGAGADNSYRNGTTTVVIGNGTVNGSVYGGGEVGRVEMNTSVTIGIGDGVASGNATSAPEIKQNVFGGGKGSETHGYSALVRGNPTVTVQGNAKVRGNVYGGGQIASVARYNVAKTDDEGAPYGVKKDMPYALNNNNSGFCTVTIRGYAEIGPETIDQNAKTSDVGHVFGAGKGILPRGTYAFVSGTTERMVSVKDEDGKVTDNSHWETFADEAAYITFIKTLALASQTNVTIDGNATVKGSVFGGSESGFVQFNTNVDVTGGTIGVEGKGGADFGNVYGGGKGDAQCVSNNYIDAGLIKGNTEISISETDATEHPTLIYHNIYGGGAYGTVGEFAYDATTGLPTGRKTYIIGKDEEAQVHNTTGGTAKITITGGTIGTTGQNNGMIFGSSRGDVGAPGEIHDYLAWVYDTEVVIGTQGSSTGPQINGSVYGGGENGHVFHDTDVKVHSGTIGINNNENVTYRDANNNISYQGKDYNYPYRGNVYGGGCGTDKYYSYRPIPSGSTLTDGEGDKYNYLAGIVQGDATVTIDGGHVVHNVYGAGAMGSVGTITNFDDLDKQDGSGNYLYNYIHKTATTDGKESYYNFGLSWPYEFTYSNTGLTSVTIKGSAIIGVSESDAKGGHVFGAARGAVEVGESDISNQRYVEAKLANVRATQLTIGTLGGTATTPTIYGSLYGGGEDGHVYEDANVTIHHGTIGHSVFGGGKGENTFSTTLLNPEDGKPKTAPEPAHSWIAGKVFGNTIVTMNGGSVGYNLYGGGNLASVGKGNYSGGTDDYSTAGYGESPGENSPLWVSSFNSASPITESNKPDNPYHFLNSGITRVRIYGGTVGTNTGSDTDGIPYGNVFGGSRGRAASSSNYSPRYKYVPDFFLGYVNNAEVTIGDASKSSAPTIKGSVYGGGQDGHVRNSTQVTINKGTIGIENDTNADRGNVYGAGSGIGKYDSEGNTNSNEDDACNYSSGSVTCFTKVDINGGTTTKIYGSVYGGGSLASVGPPFTGVQKINDISYDELKTSTDTHKSVSYTKVNIAGGTVTGSVYGASRGPSQSLLDEVFPDTDPNSLRYYNEKKFANVIWSDVNVTGGANIMGSVYGGGEKGIVKHATVVNIGTTGTDGEEYTGTISESVYGGGKEAVVGGNVTVNMNSGTVSEDIYGGGALANTNTNTDNGATTGAKVTNDGTALAITGETNSPTTTVNLLGGEIHGDAYGGGLGRLGVTEVTGEKFTQEEIDAAQEGDAAYGKTTDDWKVAPVTGVTAVEATVYGDITVQLGDNTRDSGTNALAPVNATKFYITKYDGKDIVKTGRIFGCNNLNGSPQGNVTVDVYKTVPGSHTRTVITRDPTTNEITAEESPRTYEVAAVYGGGNLANYAPTASGKKTNVIIETCDVSIEAVYGGGNAAAVPQTDVLVKGAYEIESVFGGGNGRDKYTLDGGSTWNNNLGANVNGNANTLLTGGHVHEAYGGSNKRGTITGIVTIDVGTGGACTLEVGKVVGAGKNADIDGDLIVIMGCKPSAFIPLVYAGADNANVNGNVELTITSGHFGQVFGGNNEGGVIRGHVKLNIEETGDCETPLTIDELYLGGNLASYSMYGYYNTKTNPDDDDNFIPISKDNPDHHTADVGRYPVPYDAPELNIISCTSIGRVFGGGLGSTAIIHGDPVVNINMIPGSHSADITRAGTDAAHRLGSIGGGYTNSSSEQVEGGIFGGGNAAAVYGNTTVNIGTATTVEMNTEPTHLGAKGTAYQEITKTNGDKVYQVPVEGAYITGNVYGGGNLADVGQTELKKDANNKDYDNILLRGNTFVNIGAVKGNAIVDDNDQPTGEYEYNPVYIEANSTNKYQGVIIEGNVFGGGKGEAATSGTGAFRCGKAMVTGGTNVHIGNGTVGTLDSNGKLVVGTGTVYGGGQVGRVQENSVVMIGLPVGTGETSAPIIRNNVFGGGKGVKTHGYAALLRGNTFVTVQADAKVGKSVYGGGEIASVGKYNIAQTAQDVADYHVEMGMPYSLGNENSGYCNVVVRDNAEIGPDNMRMYYDDVDKAPDDEGHVFGAGKGILPYEDLQENEKPGRMAPNNSMEYYTQEDYHPTGTETYEEAYLKFIETQALATHTEVLVGGDAFVKGSVYGGSLSGHVQHDTHVTIAGDCQIGAGFDTSTNLSKPKYTNWPIDPEDITTSWKECAHWEYNTNNDMPYDPYAKYFKDGQYYYDDQYKKSSNGGSNKATDGHTYYGNVFGGGSGVVPYAAGKWHREAGTVGGNTVVDIIGGHILTSVYGGNEHTDVGTFVRTTTNRTLVAGTGKCTVNMTGGTVGVPRTKEDIALHPVTCYVFGAGKGDQRTNFNTWTNVGETQVNISGNARIYGSTFGGGEDGHVLGDVETNIGGTVKIGNTNHSHSNVIIGTQGLSGADGNIFGGGRGFSEEALTAGVVCGNVTVNVHNGKMLGSIFGGGRLASVGTYLVPATGTGSENYGKLQPDASAQDATYYTAEDDEVIAGTKEVGDVKTPAVTASSHGHISINIYDGTIGATYAEGDNAGKLVSSDFSIGDVFGGCKGSGNNKHFGLAKSTIINMEGGTVNGNVYGGGELGYVGEALLNTTTNVYEWEEVEEGDDDAIAGLCTVDISGGTVKGNVFGAGKGKADDFECEKALVRTTSVTISGIGTTVGGNVYGGGEIGRVDQDTEVTIGDGTNSGAGTENGDASPTISGNVFGAGAGVETHGYSALVRNNATVTVQGNARVGHNVYGGGMIASVGQYGLDSNFMPETLKGGGNCRVTVKGYSVIGTSGEGHVFGAGKGINPFDADHNNINYTNNPEDPDNKKKPKRMTKTPGEGKPWPALYDNVGDGSEFIWEYYTSQEKYFNFLQTLALGTDTHVTIDGNASVHGSVYGGSESGFVQRETDVKIQGSCKILTITGTDDKPIEGNVFGGGKGLSGFEKAGRVRGNATTAISGSSTINGNVYGGGALGFVGKFTPSGNDYEWQIITNQQNQEETTGLCTVGITGGTVNGDVFGAGKGEATTFKCEAAMTRETSVSISAGTVKGNVYGGGEVGRVDQDTEVTIGAATGESAPDIKGSVFGAGAGLGTHGYSALVRGNTTLTVQNHATVGHSIYGGGEIASVGKYGLDGQKMPSILKGGGYCYVTVKDDAEIAKDVFGAGQGITPAFDKDNADKSKRSRRMTMYTNATDFPVDENEKPITTPNGTTWEYYESGSPYVWEYYQNEEDYLKYLETLALATHPEVTIEGNATIGEDVYGGGERGITKGSVIVTVNGGTIARDVYGGGALADTNTTNSVDLDGDGVTETVDPTTTVNLHGGIISRNVYGGGLGQLAKAAVDAQDAVPYNDYNEYNTDKGTSLTAEQFEALSDAEKTKTPAIGAKAAVDAVEAKVYGNISVKLNETIATDNCEVKGTIFGCNNLNGSPQAGVDVHIYKTYTVSGKPAKNTNNYEVTAVYGGGNLAAYYPDDATIRENATAYVTIDGCNLTSIGTVYGGGNAASVPGTEVIVNGTYEIGRVFGGGNGADDYQIDDDWYDNPGANVGYQSYAYFVRKGETGYDAATHGSGTQADPYKVLEYTSSDESSKDASTKEKRIANYGNGYGDGKAHVTIYRGTVHEVYGGSNSRGNVRKEARTTLEDLTTSPVDDDCPFDVGEAYGGGRNAPMDGDAVLEIGCISGLEKAYGGAANADVNGNVVLNITNGTYDQVFGGNDAGGAIRGSITVNIEETGCKPIIIGELYGGGCNAAYSVYGYDASGNVLQSGSNPVADPVVNVKSFTSIGNIYGGGYGPTATMVGNPEVNINVVKGKYSGQTSADIFENKGFVLKDDPNIAGKKRYSKTVDKDNPHTVYVPAHEENTIGAIYNVFGGGNAAAVIGTPHVNVGTLTGELITLVTKPIEDSEGKKPSETGWIPSYELTTAEGVDIRGNVYGAGNNADVTGDTEVVIGKNNDVKTYIFKSFSEETGGTAWSSGLAQTTGVTKNGNAEVVILSNGKYTNFVGQKYYVAPDATTNGSTRTALKDASGNTTGLWVAISEHKIYNFTSYGASTGGTQYSTGTAAPTGNFKTIGGQEHMQIQVLTNPGEASWVGKTFYVPVSAKTDGTERTQLYKADGTAIDVWVEIAE